MTSFCAAFPVLPGKASIATDELTGYMRENMDAYVASRDNAGVTMERVFMQATAMGDLVVAYLEADRDLAAVLQAYLTSGQDFDRHFRERNEEMTGLDFAQPLPPTRLLAEWKDPDVLERRPGLAFAVPLLPGARELGLAFAQEAFVQRREELTESRRRLGQNREAIYLNETPMGDLTCVYLEGRDPVAANRSFAASGEPFDVWFKQELANLYPPQIDFNQPLPPIPQFWDWQRAIA